MNDDQKDVDKVSGVETTGHEWDGIKELNNPMPRWWLWVFYITIIWSIGYWIVYPAWPVISGATKGSIGWTQYKKLADDQAEIIARQTIYMDKFSRASFQEIMHDNELYAFAMAGGQAAFKENCATCHGSGGAGNKGYPNLNDDDWLWGGTLEDIHFTIKHGIRSIDDDTRLSEMLAFGKDNLLKPEDINAVTDYVLTLSGKEQKPTYERGKTVFQENCASCHGLEGKGLREVGAPNLADAIWLYSGDRKTIYETVFYGRKSVMPAWKDRLDENTIRALTIYLHELGGGEPDKPPLQQEPVNADGTGQ
ncbi:MAG: cytochrome-c oxidase, cbb3-type subunit III [Alphaproteobacteria bacterium]|nr:cytochrome-c oxidase, cbb3-type subunit III [Alphaproteobacteria bacterium]